MKFYMKHILILIIFLTGLIGCSKNKIEVDSIDDQDYLSIYDNVDELPVVIIPDSNKVYDEIENKFQKSIKDTSWYQNFSFNSLKYGRIGFSHFEFICRIYLNNVGGIDKVTFITVPNQEFKDFILAEIKEWKFIPAKKDGKNIKSQFDWMMVAVHSSFSPSFLSSLPQENFPLSNISYSKTEAEVTKIMEGMPDKMPEPIGGIKAIQEKIHYPEIAKRAGIEGKVFIRADIDKEGNVTKTEVLKKLGHGLDEAAVKAVSQTKFKPAKKNNKEVEAQVVIPILFKLDSSNSGK